MSGTNSIRANNEILTNWLYDVQPLEKEKTAGDRLQQTGNEILLGSAAIIGLPLLGKPFKKPYQSFKNMDTRNGISYLDAWRALSEQTKGEKAALKGDNIWQSYRNRSLYHKITGMSSEIPAYIHEKKPSKLNAKQSELIALDSAKKLKIATYGNIGDIKYTTRTDIPSGGVWCDGAEYTQAAFPDVYQMLIDGKISSIDFASFEECLSANGVCGLFALDTATTRFKVPKLSGAYIKAGQAPSMFAAESLPNIKGNTGYNWGGTWGPSGVFASASGSDGMFGGTSGITSRVDFNASRVSSTYQDGAKVNPDHVVYRAYVILYASAAEASVAQAQEFMTVLGNKANVGLDNITAGAKNLIAGLGMPS